MSVVTLDRHARTAVVTISRPEVRNAIDPSVVAALTDAFERIHEADVDAVVLAGEGAAFCSGADLNAVAAMDAEGLRRYLRSIQRLADVVRSCPLPTIAAVHGAAVGGGMELAVNCDVRLASTDAWFLCPEVDHGLLMTNGASQLLQRLVGDGWAREMLLFGTRVDASTALRVGLVSRVVSPEELLPRALSMAGRVAHAVAPAVAATKRLLNRDPEDWSATLSAELSELIDLASRLSYRDIHVPSAPTA
ncbi:enoyl-CoA hydratase/isomerase family protein [Nocardioides sp.]|uniref:enoyl-CoA hydratase/isomerase family protein n=1 Tax=Nocardioides sp. TaxID=35761 RepID=UPI0037834ED4